MTENIWIRMRICVVFQRLFAFDMNRDYFKTIYFIITARTKLLECGNVKKNTSKVTESEFNSIDSIRSKSKVVFFSIQIYVFTMNLNQADRICEICQRRIGEMCQFLNFVDCHCIPVNFYHISCVRNQTRTGNDFVANCGCRRTFNAEVFYQIFTQYFERICSERVRIRNMPQENRPQENRPWAWIAASRFLWSKRTTTTTATAATTKTTNTTNTTTTSF